MVTYPLCYKQEMETYEKKLARRLRIRTNFPGLLKKCPLRHVDKVQSLSDEQKKLLSIALDAGLKSIPVALEIFENGQVEEVTVEDILRNNKFKRFEEN